MIFDFANLLFGGPCSAHCKFCIGKQIPSYLSPNNLNEFPPRNLDSFIRLVKTHKIRQVILSGTTTDPQCYRHEARLLHLLRSRLDRQTLISLHTNGRHALQKLALINQYDRICISLPSFAEDTYTRMMGVAGIPPVKLLLAKSRPPIKISCVVSGENAEEIPSFLNHCLALGIRRVVLRKAYGDHRSWSDWLNPSALGLKHQGSFRGNPVYVLGNLEVTLWDFLTSQVQSINLFSSGLISTQYLLDQAKPGGR
jgi:MoaA/NifB/PqqE/SkfB family radical SAM enzyme